MITTFHPLDARTNMPIDSIDLSFPLWGSLLEPLAAPVHILAALPDIRVGMISMVVWLVVFFIAYSTYVFYKDKSIKISFYAFFNLLLLSITYLIFIALIPLPSWTLDKKNEAMIVTELHSHTLLSHDGVANLSDNLSIHKQRGYDLVAVTNHPRVLKTTLMDSKLGNRIVKAVPGKEIPVYYGGKFYLNVFGIDTSMLLPYGLYYTANNTLPPPPRPMDSVLWSVKKLIHKVHEHGGIITVVALHLNIQQVKGLIQAGVDAFEIVNIGQHPLPKDIRQVLLQAQKEKGIVLISCNDWHGWTGVMNAWTVIQEDSIDTMRHETLDTRALNVLRKHQWQSVIPVIAYPIYKMTPLDIIFAPFVAVFEYIKTLSLQQLCAWGGYFILFLLLSKYWQWQRMSLAESIRHVLLIGMSVSILWHSILLFNDCLLFKIQHQLAYKISLYGMFFSGIVIIVEGIRLYPYMDISGITRPTQRLALAE